MNRSTGTRIARATLLVSVLTLSTFAQLDAQQPERHTLDGAAVAVYNLAGTVRIERGTGSDVVVEVRRGGADAAELRIERRNVDGRAALVVLYPDGDIVYRQNGRGSSQTMLQVRDDGTFYGDRRGGDRVTVSSRGSGTEAHADLRILVPAGRSVDLRLGVGEVAAADIDGDLDIDVGAARVGTSNTRGNLRIDTGSGRVTVTDAEGDVLVDTGSGSVELANIRGERLHVDTGSGAVEGSGITAASVLVDTGSGAVTLSRLTARDIQIDTGSGGVELDLLTDVDRVLIDTGSGGVRLAVPEDLGATFDIDGSSVRVDVPATLNHSGRRSARGSIGDGRGEISIDTGSGGIRIVRR